MRHRADSLTLTSIAEARPRATAVAVAAGPTSRDRDRRRDRLGEVREPGHLVRRLQRAGRRGGRVTLVGDPDVRARTPCTTRPRRHRRPRRHATPTRTPRRNGRVGDRRAGGLPGAVRSPTRPRSPPATCTPRRALVGQRVLRRRQLPRALHGGRRRHRAGREGQQARSLGRPGRRTRPHSTLEAAASRRPGVRAEPAAPAHRRGRHGRWRLLQRGLRRELRTHLHRRPGERHDHARHHHGRAHRHRVLNVAKQGQSGTGLAINGVFAFVIIDEEALAFIEDRATVAAGGDIDLDAENKDRVVNVAGAQARSAAPTRWASRSRVTVIGTTDTLSSGRPRPSRTGPSPTSDGASVRAFIGDARSRWARRRPVGVVGTVVRPAGDVKLTAHERRGRERGLDRGRRRMRGLLGAPAGSADLSSPTTPPTDVDVSAAGSGALNVLRPRARPCLRPATSASPTVAGHLSARGNGRVLVAGLGGRHHRHRAARHRRLAFALNTSTSMDTTSTTFVRSPPMASASSRTRPRPCCRSRARRSPAAAPVSPSLSRSTWTLADRTVEAGFGPGTTLDVTGDVVKTTSVVE